ncbi:MAG: hypothetical protein ACK5MI_06010 [Mangrovibacterium sp.]
MKHYLGVFTYCLAIAVVLILSGVNSDKDSTFAFEATKASSRKIQKTDFNQNLSLLEGKKNQQSNDTLNIVKKVERKIFSLNAHH